MKFLVLLITLGSYKFWGLRVNKSADQWFSSLRASLEKRLGGYPRIVMLLTLLLPIAAAGGVVWALQDWLFGLVGIVLHVLLLFYAFGRGNLLEQTSTYLTDWRAGNLESAYLDATQTFGLQRDIRVDDAVGMHRNVRIGLFYQWFQQIFLIIFWYLLAGPLVALFIRLVCLYDADERLEDDHSEAVMPLQLQHAIEWLPARLMGLTFAIAGNFTLCFKEWNSALFNWSMPTEEVLHRSGMAALGVCEIDTNPDIPAPVVAVSDADIACFGEEIETIQGLIVRTLVISVVICALFILS